MPYIQKFLRQIIFVYDDVEHLVTICSWIFKEFVRAFIHSLIHCSVFITKVM